jgi:cholesterol oxidase
VEVRYVSQAPPQEHEQAAGNAGAAKWTIECNLIGPDAPSTDPPLSFSLSANVLVLAAGTLGTNEILLRSRERESLQMSPAVGRWFGADGDFFRVGFNGESAANTLGYGSDPGGARRKAENDSVGACITSVIDLRDPAVPATQGIILEDIGLGGALSEATAVAFTDWAAVAGKP